MDANEAARHSYGGGESKAPGGISRSNGTTPKNAVFSSTTSDKHGTARLQRGHATRFASGQRLEMLGVCARGQADEEEVARQQAASLRRTGGGAVQLLLTLGIEPRMRKYPLPESKIGMAGK